MKFFRELFYLRKSDRQTILALLVLIAIGLCVIYFTGEGTSSMDDTSATVHSPSSLDSLSARQYPNPSDGQDYAARSHATTVQEARLFPFDPNTADSAQLLQLGLRPWQVHNIRRYREAGGVYSRPEDFARLYGLTVGDYERLKPYIRIARRFQPASTLVGNTPSHEGRLSDGRAPAASPDTLKRAVKLKPHQTINLCTADTNQLRLVPGIGPYYASRIYSYGQRLGGYVSVDQLDDIDDLPENIKHYFVADGAAPRKLNINRLTLDQLRRHPYVNFYQAKAIVDYRRLHGSISSLQQLKLSKDFPPAAIQRLEPYVEY
jgi:DNA uptake protein ComE-like DNA-binding protein